MSKSEVSICIPEDLIKTLVMAEVSAALGKQDELIAAVVKSAIQAKKDNYSKQTIFEEQVHEQIRAVAVEAFKGWLGDNAEKVRAAILRELEKNKKAVADSLAKALIDGRFYVKPVITVEIGTDADSSGPGRRY